MARGLLIRARGTEQSSLYILKWASLAKGIETLPKSIKEKIELNR